MILFMSTGKGKLMCNLSNEELQELLREIDKNIGVNTPSEKRNAIIDELADRGHLVIKSSFFHVIYWNGVNVM